MIERVDKGKPCAATARVIQIIHLLNYYSQEHLFLSQNKEWRLLEIGEKWQGSYKNRDYRKIKQLLPWHACVYACYEAI